MQPLLQLAYLHCMYYWQKELFAGIYTCKKKLCSHKYIFMHILHKFVINIKSREESRHGQNKLMN